MKKQVLAIMDSRTGRYLYPVTYRKGQIVGKLLCGPFPKDFGTMAHAEKVIADIKAMGKTTQFEVVSVVCEVKEVRR